MRAKLKGGVTYAGAQVINLAAWREGHRPKPLTNTAFPATDRPGMDFNQMHHGLKLAAQYVREGRMTAKNIAKLLEGLSVNARAACLAGHDLETRVRCAERLLKPQLGGKEGRSLVRAIFNASMKAAAQERRDARKAEREGG